MNAKEHLKQRNAVSEIPSHTSLWFFYAVRQAWRVKRDTLHRKVRTSPKSNTPICPGCDNGLQETILQEPYPN